MTIAQAIKAANDQRPISYRERSEALQVLKDATAASWAASCSTYYFNVECWDDPQPVLPTGCCFEVFWCCLSAPC